MYEQYHRKAEKFQQQPPFTLAVTPGLYWQSEVIECR
jgi:hypothetical protein